MFNNKINNEITTQEEPYDWGLGFIVRELS